MDKSVGRNRIAPNANIRCCVITLRQGVSLSFDPLEANFAVMKNSTGSFFASRWCALGGAINLLMVVSYVLIGGCGSDRWTANVYPNTEDMEVYRTLGPYNSQHDCSANAQALLVEKGWRSGAFECGLNCEPAPDIQTNVCERLEPDI